MCWTSVGVQHRWLLITISEEYISDIHFFSVNVRYINIYRVLCLLTKKNNKKKQPYDFPLTHSLLHLH